MDVLKEPLTQKEIRERMDEDCWIKGVIRMDLGDITSHDFEWFLDELSERLTGTVMLMEIQYSVVGHEGNALHLEVEGNASEIIGEEEED